MKQIPKLIELIIKYLQPYSLNYVHIIPYNKKFKPDILFECLSLQSIYNNKKQMNITLKTKQLKNDSLISQYKQLQSVYNHLKTKFDILFWYQFLSDTLYHLRPKLLNLNFFYKYKYPSKNNGKASVISKQRKALLQEEYEVYTQQYVARQMLFKSEWQTIFGEHTRYKTKLKHLF